MMLDVPLAQQEVVQRVVAATAPDSRRAFELSGEGQILVMAEENRFVLRRSYRSFNSFRPVLVCTLTPTTGGTRVSCQLCMLGRTRAFLWLWYAFGLVAVTVRPAHVEP
jgi:hypothetical protein